MPITFYCTCGKKLKAPAPQAGRRGQCTACGRMLTVPAVSTPRADAPPIVLDAPWYFSREGQLFGPLSPDDLKEAAAGGGLGPADLVLAPGAAQWIAAHDVPELFPQPPPAAIDRPQLPEPAPPPPPPAARVARFESRRQVLAEAQVVPDASHCVQCGICTFNCPMGIDVRAHARRGRPIHDSRCLTCSECVHRCPRGVLQFERLTVLSLGT